MSDTRLPQQALDQLHQGHYTQATSLFQQWAAQEPGQRIPQWYLGLIALLEGDREGVERHWWTLITQLNPTQDPEVTRALKQEVMRVLEQEAVAFVRLNQPGLAKVLCQQILELNPSYIPAYLNLGQLLGWMEQYGEALEILQKAADIAPDHPEIPYEQAMVRKRMGQPLQAAALLRRVLKLQPDHAASLALLDSIWASDCAWHFPMINDLGRNQAYQQAIKRGVGAGDHVLDIGTGSGLLALMAARAGAEQVTACEMVTPLAEKAVEIVQTNGYGHRIRVLPKRSTDLDIPQDLSQPVDVIVSETFSADLVSEGALGFLSQGLRDLARPEARVIPRAAILYCALFEGKQIWQQRVTDQVCGFDLSGFNEFSWPFRLFTQIDCYPFRLLSEIIFLEQIEFITGLCQPINRQIEIPAQHSGLCHGVVCWFDLILDEATILTSGPLDQEGKFRARHWGQMIQLLESPLPVQPHQSIPFLFECRERLLSLRYQGSAD